MSKLKEIICFQPAKTGILGHPDRYCYQVAEVVRDFDLAQSLRLVGSEGAFVFVNGVCPKWLGEYVATIVGDLPDSERMRADRIENL
jgi:hypothetical protein